MRNTAQAIQTGTERDQSSERMGFDDVEWPDSTLDVDDDEFARAIAAGRREERHAA